MAVANYGTNTVSVFVNTSTSGSINSGSFAAKADFTTGGGSYGIKLGDIDDDGKPDMVVSCFGYIVSVLRNTSSGGTLSFAAKVDFGTNQNSTSVTLGDLDGDGKMDIIITNSAPNNISVFRNISTVGNITFATKVDYSTGTGPESVVIGDLDGDGKIDLAVANQTSNSVSVFLNTSNTGTISLADRVSFTTGTTPYNLTIGDLDGDGKLDLAVANDGSNTVSILRNTSTINSLSFATKVDFTTGLIPVSVAIGDIDGDGKADLAITNRTANSVSVLTNTSSIGSISFAAKVDFTTGSGAEFVAIGDLDGDGKPELAIANSGSNSVSVLHNEDIKFYYTQGSGNPANLINWNSAIDGSGSAPINLISAATYIIQNSHTLTTIGTLFFGTLGSVLEIQNGGILVANHAITMASGSNYQLDAGSLFNMNASLTVDSILMVGGKLVIGSGATLTLNGPVITTAGVFSGSTSSNLIIGSDIGTLLFDQTTPGTTNVLHVLTIGSGNAASLTLGNNLNIDPTGKISFNAAGAKSLTTTGQTLTLLSTSVGSAMIDNTNGATITGLIIAQNYLPASGRKYRFLASPLVGGTSMEWRNNGVNTSGEGIAITGSTGIVDSSVSHQSSAFYYLETNTAEGTNINGSGKWPAIDGNTSLVNGAGYRVFVRGDRTISLLTANTINNPTTIWVQGTYPANPISPTITYTTAAANGWNLVGNPYPCTLNWDLVTSGDRTNIDNAIYIWHPANTNNTSGGYASYVNGNGTGTPNAGTAFISSGQAFFVKANAASPVLNIRESHKESAEAGGRLFKAGNLKPNSIRLNLSNDTQKLDDAVLYFENGATTNFDGEFDAFDLTNNIGFLTDDGKDTLSIIGNPMYTGSETYKINARLGSGNYKIQFTDLNSFVSLPEAYLVDKYLSKALLLADKASYSFIVDQNNPFTYGSDRFELQFGKMPTGLLNNDNQNVKLIVFPNPANDVLNVSLSRINTIEQIHIYDALGKLVININTNQTQIDISPINTGIYTIEVITSNGRFITKFIK